MILKLIKYYFSLFYWERASIGAVKKMQLRKFRQIFEYARENSAFYGDLYTKHGVMDLKIETWGDIKKVPVIDKYDLKKYNVEDILTVPVSDKINLHTTSGSSGEPFRLYYDKFTDFTSHVRVFYALRKAAKYSPLKRIVLITRYDEQDRFEIENKVSVLQRMQNVFGVFKRDIISIYRDPDYIIEKLLELKPTIVWSTPSILEIVVNRMAERNIKLHINALFFTSENLSPGQYNKFRKHLSNNIVDIYGAMESPCLGYEINQSGRRYVYPNSNLFEYVNVQNTGSGKTGDVVITNLLNFSMPIIRYNLKDMGEVLNDISAPHKIIGNIIGRKDDILSFPDGNQFAHHHAYEMFMDFEECEQYKFIQKKDGTIILQLKPKATMNTDMIKQKALSRWNYRFEKYSIEIEFVDKFTIDKKTGKFKNIEKEL